MGQVISLTDRRAERRHERAHGGGGDAAFFFALDCPASYIVAEQVERELGEIAWMPILAAPVTPSGAVDRFDLARPLAQAARLPLIQPDRFPFDARPVARAASHAARHGAGAAFARAAMRMAFAGGFDLEDEDVIAEAAAAAGLGIEETLAAARSPAADSGLMAAARGLLRRGILETPVLRVGPVWSSGAAALGPTPVTGASSRLADLRPRSTLGEIVDL